MLSRLDLMDEAELFVAAEAGRAVFMLSARRV